jgi:hypothetical protein
VIENGRRLREKSASIAGKRRMEYQFLLIYKASPEVCKKFGQKTLKVAIKLSRI